ncbi:MAG: rhodanese-like domain-containing protein [bacterium]|jgi:hypothetical protein|nr:hypothetical protein [Betaproteobacteria bacterium]
MDGLHALLAQYGLSIAFANVLPAKLGAPLPTLPALLVTGAMATEGLLSAPMLPLLIGWKWWQRRRFFRALRMARVSATDLQRMRDEGMQPLVLDVRSPEAREQYGRRFPGAIEVDPADPEPADPELALAGLPPDREIVVFCT